MSVVDKVTQAQLRQRPAFRRYQCATPTNSQRYRLVRGNNLAQVDTHAGSQRAYADVVLHEPGQHFSVFFDTFYLQRSVELKDHGPRRIQRHKRDVCACPEHMLIWNNLGFDTVVGNVKTAGDRLWRGLL